MPLFKTIESSIANLKNAIGTAAYFVISGSPGGQSKLWFCQPGPENGSFDPAFLLSAYVLEFDRKPENVSIVTTYFLSDQWPTAFKGIAHLGKEQQTFLKLEKASAAPGNPFAQVYEIKLESPATTAVTNYPDKVIDDLFAPPGATGDGKIDGHGTHTIPRLYMMAAIVMKVGPTNGRSFLETFTDLRSKNAADKAKWFKDWVASVQLPKDVFFVSDGKLLRGGGPDAKTAIKTAKAGITSLNELFAKLGRFSQNPKDAGKSLGLRDQDKDPIKASLAKFFEKKTEETYLARIITFIPGNPASAKLRDAARKALVAKLEKYDRTDHTADFSRLYSETPLPPGKPLNTNVEKVLLYLRPFLAQTGVNL